MTKPLVTYAALRLVESGTLDLDKPLVKYLDDVEALKIRKLFDQEPLVERDHGSDGHHAYYWIAQLAQRKGIASPV